MFRPLVVSVCAVPVVTLVSLGTWGTAAYAGAFDDYGLVDSFDLPAGASVFDALSDGRLVTLSGDDVYVESATGSRAFQQQGALAGMDVGFFGSSFLRVSPDGSRFAVGNNGGANFDNFQVGVFDVNDLTGQWFDVPHFDAAWYDANRLAVTAADFGVPAFVTLFDANSPDPADPVNPVVIDGVGGASGGIAFDAAGNVFTANGFAIDGPSETGDVRAFNQSAWQEALDTGIPIDFETQGTLIVSVLSGGALGFDGEGNLHVGGGDFGGDGGVNFAALIRESAVADAFAGNGPVDVDDADLLRRLDPDKFINTNFYDVTFNGATGELYLREGLRVYVYAVPEPGTAAMLAAAIGLLPRRRRNALFKEKTFKHRGTETQRTATTKRATAVFLAFLRASVSLWSDCLFFFRSSAGATVRTKSRQGLCLLPRYELAVVLLSLTIFPPAGVHAGESPFATDVLLYEPAPGQFVNDAVFNDPGRAVGAPVGGGTNAPGNTSVVTLGGFGGVIVLMFDHTVEDHRANPFGIDAIVFGNAYWVGVDDNRHWAECAHIEISRDLNDNGLADDAWYLIPGSHISDPGGQTESQTWDDDFGDATYPPANPLWLPPGRSGEWTTWAYRLPADVFEMLVVANPNGPLADEEGIFGYADYAPTLVLGDTDGDNIVDDFEVSAEVFYTFPDDPYVVGVSPGSGGGDGFDIAWAIDAATGEFADLDGFDFLRITTAGNFINGAFGELSAEIDAAADVRPAMFGDGDYDGDVDADDLFGFTACMTGPADPVVDVLCGVMDFDGDQRIDLRDFAGFQMGFTDA